MPLPEQQNRLLVVDDDFPSRRALSRRLEGRGYIVDTADGAVAALDKILREHYDLVLLDQRMPDMTGLDLLKLLRATHSQTDLPVIMVTGVGDNQSIVDALQEGANDYVIKPVGMPEITARIQAQLTRAEHARGTESLTEIDQAGDAYWEWDPASGVAQFSRPWKDLMGSANPGSEEIGEWFDAVHLEDVLRVRQDFQAFLDGVAHEVRIEHRLRRDAGRPRWVLCRAAAARDSGGRVVRVSGSLTDIDRLKTLDPLTGLGNRQYLEDAMTSALSLKAEDGESVRHTWMLLLLDVHGFRDYNDVGQLAGDRLLVKVANRLRAAIGASGFSAGSTLVRCGPDEFAVLARCAKDARDAGVLADILLAAVFDPLAGEDAASHVSANIGVAFSAAAGVTLDQMLTDADLALKVARADGPNRWHVSLADLKERARLRAATARDFRHAVERDQLVAHYQPQIDLTTRKLTGFEALMRWRHPERGLLPPSEFISMAEKTGMIVAAGEWILEEACRQLRIWQDQLPCVPPTTVAVNLSPRQLNSPNLLEHLRRVLEETGIPPATLHLEVTESCLIDEKESARKVLAALRATGVRLDLDDFGTGYASLAYLNVVHFDTLKIDKSFVLRMDSDGESFAIIKTIMALAQDLHMGVVAEGIETESQLRQLTGLGCRSGQGFYFAKPVNAQDAGEILRLSLQSPVPELFVA